VAFALHEVHAVEAEGFHFDEGLRAGDLGLGDVVDEHVGDGAFTIFDVCCFGWLGVLWFVCVFFWVTNQLLAWLPC
jgi:hypothetical protein